MNISAQARWLKHTWPELKNSEIARGLRVTPAAVTSALRAQKRALELVEGIDPRQSLERTRSWLAVRSRIDGCLAPQKRASTPTVREHASGHAALMLAPDQLQRTKTAACAVGMSFEAYLLHVIDTANAQATKR